MLIVSSGFGESDRNNRFSKLRPVAHLNRTDHLISDFAFLRSPHLVANRIVNHANDDLALSKRSAMELQKCGMP